MLSPLLPRQAGNSYQGSRLALWFLGALVLLKCVIGFNSIINGQDVASTADGIPLDTFTPAGARAVVSLFALLGVSSLMFSVLCVVVLIRYRSLVPLMFVLVLLEHLGKRLVHQFMPITTTGSPPASIVNLIILTLIVAGLMLSLWKRHGAVANSSSTVHSFRL